MSKISDKLVMPEFTIDTVEDASTHNTIPGIKRMYDIALALNDSLMQWGGPGVGKSQAVQQWNAEKVEEYNKRIASGEKVKPWNPVVCDVRLSMKEPVDMIGIPTIINVNNSSTGKTETATVWAIPSMWPKDDDKYSGGVIHLDEMNQGQAAILNAAFQLIQDRQLGDYKVPSNYLIIASSNPPAFNQTVTDLSIPLSNRFSHFNIKADFDGWLQYRQNNNGNLDVMQFLKSQSPDMLYDKDTMNKRVGDDASVLYSDIVVTPRSWEVIEKLMNLPEGNKNNGGFSFEEKQAYSTGRLGLRLSLKFFEWVKNKSKYQSWEEILKKGKPFKDESIDSFWVTQLACMSTINNTTDDDKCREYVLNFIKATRELKNTAYKVINVTQLVNSKRLRGNLNLFNATKDAMDILSLAAKSLRA